jgi:AAA domain
MCGCVEAELSSAFSRKLRAPGEGERTSLSNPAAAQKEAAMDEFPDDAELERQRLEREAEQGRPKPYSNVEALAAIKAAKNGAGHNYDDDFHTRIAKPNFEDEDFERVERTPKPADDKPPLAYVDLAAELVAREWLITDRIPIGNVTLLSGEGAIGKSLLLSQLAAAVVIPEGKWWASSPWRMAPWFISHRKRMSTKPGAAWRTSRKASASRARR